MEPHRRSEVHVERRRSDAHRSGLGDPSSRERRCARLRAHRARSAVPHRPRVVAVARRSAQAAGRCSARKRASRRTACDLVACVTWLVPATLISGCGRVADLREVPCDCVCAGPRTRALPMSTRRRYLRGAAVALVLALGLRSTALPASADRNSINDKKRQQQQVRQQRALIASQINTLQASDRRSTRPSRPQRERAGHPGRARVGPARARPGEPRCGRSLGRASRTATIVDLRSCRPPSPASRSTATCTHSATRCWRCSTRRTSVTPHRSARSSRSCTSATPDVADQIKQAREDLTAQQQLAEDAAARADASRQTITGELEKLQAAKQQQLQFEDKVQQRLDAALAESAVLESQDKQLANEISKDQAAIAAQLRRRGGGRGTALPPIGNVNVVNAGGIYVAALDRGQRVSPSRCRAADGVPLAGWGYRDTSAQVALGRRTAARASTRSTRCRRTNAIPRPRRRARRCTNAASRSTSPVAAPTIGSHSSPCYKWLSAHASQYGLYNLPSEPWHWSTNGN